MQYSLLADVYQKLESTAKRLKKIKVLSDFIKSVPEDDFEQVFLLVQGKIFPDFDERKIGVASKILCKAIALATGIDISVVLDEWKRIGDLGEVAEKLCAKKTQSTLFQKSLTVKKVFSNLQKLAFLEGEGTVDKKIALVSELLTCASPLEAKYVIRTILEDLRVGLGEGTLRDSVLWAFFSEELGLEYLDEKNEIVVNREKYNEFSEIVQSAYDVLVDFAVVALIAKTKGLNGLKSVELSPGKPVKVMLYQKAVSIPDAFDKVGRPAAFEFKYDGFMALINKKGNEIRLFTRRLEDVTRQFPDVVEKIRNINGDFILNAEIVGVDSNGRYLPFQKISQRIKRKYDIELMAKKFPVVINVFDILFFNGKSLLNEPFVKRRKILETLCPEILAVQLVTDNDFEAERFYKKSLAAGNEGVMVKNLNGVYKPGSRVGYGVKVKPVMETVDAVIVAAEWGEGKRSDWLASFTIAVLDKDSDSFVEIGKVGTGIKEKDVNKGDDSSVSFNQLTELLKPLIIEDKGKEVRVKPEIVIEVNYEEIQKSNNYGSGFALRFPRLIKLRPDRSIKDITTLDELEIFFRDQRGRNK
ncbi:DNA ligase [Candidatus Woesearchaeota archaeon ex4484_78]|nr:MAG: DNA ligase [Candidatus Woesearchaeota archaeon ex4484_78]